MKTYSRIFAALLVWLASLVAATAYPAQQRPTTTNKQQPPVVLETQGRGKSTPTPTPTPGRLKLPVKISIDRSPRVWADPQTRRPDYPRMPNLMGVELNKARSVIAQTQSNLRLSVVEGQYTNNYQPGVVIQQSPEPGTYLKPGSTVILNYNPQPPYPRMPNLVGLDVATAERRLISLAPNSRPQRAISRERNPNYTDGVVINQLPQPRSELRPDTRIVLYINPSQPVPKMPDLIGMDIGTAESRLSRMAPTIRAQRARARRYNPSYGADVVVSQSPNPGADLNPNAQVILYLNPPPPIPTMPNLVGMDAVAAGNRLRQEAPNVPWQQQQANANDRNYAVGIVLSQSPNPGAELRQGSRIVLYINPRPTPTPQPTPVTVPDVRGLSYSQANSVLTSGQLRISATSNPTSNIGDYRVVGQRPQPGGLMPIGGTVFVTIEPPPPPPTPTASPTPTPTASPTPTPTSSPTPTPAAPPVIVPDVQKKELTEAIGLVRAAQLEIGEVTKKDSNVAANIVLEQQPLPGQRVAAGTRINLVISKLPETGGFINVIPKVLGVMGLGFLAFLLGSLWKRFRSSGEQHTKFPSINPSPDPESPPPASALSFRTTMNASSPEFAASTELHTSFALQFQPKADWGQQYITLTGGLIAAESEEL